LLNLVVEFGHFCQYTFVACGNQLILPYDTIGFLEKGNEVGADPCEHFAEFCTLLDQLAELLELDYLLDAGVRLHRFEAGVLGVVFLLDGRLVLADQVVHLVYRHLIILDHFYF